MTSLSSATGLVVSNDVLLPEVPQGALGTGSWIRQFTAAFEPVIHAIRLP
jgi:hypothetical protein